MIGKLEPLTNACCINPRGAGRARHASQSIYSTSAHKCVCAHARAGFNICPAYTGTASKVPRVCVCACVCVGPKGVELRQIITSRCRPWCAELWSTRDTEDILRLCAARVDLEWLSLWTGEMRVWAWCFLNIRGREKVRIINPGIRWVCGKMRLL